VSLACEIITDPQRWNAALRGLPHAHFLQTWEWGDFKQATGWQAKRCLFHNEAAEVIALASLLMRRVGPLKLMYVPKGPIFATPDGPYTGAVLEYLEHTARRGGIWLKIDPDIIAARGLPPDSPYQDSQRPNRPDDNGQQFLKILQIRGWRYSTSQVQFRHTFYTDLSLSEEALLGQMNQATRRKIRQAEKNRVMIRIAENEADLKALFDLYQLTSQRQGFLIRPWEYYQELWQKFWQVGMAHILLAEVDNQLAGGVILFHFGQRVWYFNGMSSNDHRDSQANFALQWAAIRWAKAQGYQIYDWWGAPDNFVESDPMWGVYRFKDGFGAELVRHIGAWDYVPYPPLYFAYEKLMPRVLNWLKRRNRSTLAGASV
jgi:lipid II:glycine glycyltransferase (peptidoglycan interpeptide bridge formation enzyme)